MAIERLSALQAYLLRELARGPASAKELYLRYRPAEVDYYQIQKALYSLAKRGWVKKGRAVRSGDRILRREWVITPKGRERLKEVGRKEAWRDPLLEALAANPGAKAKDLARLLGMPLVETLIRLQELLKAGKARREGCGTSRSPYRWFLMEEGGAR